MAYDYEGRGQDIQVKGTTYRIPKDEDIADAPKAFEDYTNSIPFSEYVEVVNVDTNTTVDDSFNGKMIVATSSIELTLNDDLSDGFTLAAVAESNATIAYFGVDKENLSTEQYEVATVVTVNGTNILSVAGEASSAECPDCLECPEPELPGVGGWATIEEVSGDYTPHRYNDGPNGVGGTDWVAYEFTDDGFVTNSDGLVEMLLVASGSMESNNSGGKGGGVFTGIQVMPAGQQDIVIGKGPSSDIAASYVYKDNGEVMFVGSIGGGWSQPAKSGNGGADLTGNGVFSTIADGTKVGYGGGAAAGDSDPARDYGQGNPPRPNSGGASTKVSSSGSGSYGASGVCIIRVPKEYADNVIENNYRWLNFATVENGVVTKVTKTPDNQPYKAAADEVECDANVQEGYLYENGEFTAPKPDYSEQDTTNIDDKERSVKRRRSK